MALTFPEKCIRHIQEDGCDDVIMRPFFVDRPEIGLIGLDSWSDFFRTEIGQAINQNPVSVGPVSRIRVPKGRYTFRDIAQISVTDTLKFTALVFSIAPIIESSRLDSNVVFSNRFQNNRIVMLDRSRYDLFRKKSKDLSDKKKHTVKVITDISNFYDRLNLHKLENILLEIGCEDKTVKKINDILSQWSQTQSFGLPVGSDASRLLAEAMLINVDRELSENGVRFIRYVDDFRIFCTSTHDAYEAMQILTDALAGEGLFLNSGKTKVIDLSEAHEEERATKGEFESIDTDEKIEKSRVVRSGYTSRIARYYKYPGKEAIKELQKVDLSTRFNEIQDFGVHEDRLKEFVKAAIYSAKPDFSWLKGIIERFPHLIPYVVDALDKEFGRDDSRFDDEFRDVAAEEFRSLFSEYSRNDYFRIQCARSLAIVDGQFGDFLSAEILKMEPTREILFSQVLYRLGTSLKRSTLLKLIDRFQSYGSIVKFAVVWCLKTPSILSKDESRAKIKALSKGETNAFILRALKEKIC